jgi:hypothetical protein
MKGAFEKKIESMKREEKIAAKKERVEIRKINEEREKHIKLGNPLVKKTEEALHKLYGSDPMFRKYWEKFFSRESTRLAISKVAYSTDEMFDCCIDVYVGFAITKDLRIIFIDYGGFYGGGNELHYFELPSAAKPVFDEILSQMQTEKDIVRYFIENFGR